MDKDEALDLALEALELHGKQYPHMVKGYCLDAITAIKQALAADVREPIGYAVPTFDFDNSVIKKVHYAGTVPVYTTPPAHPSVPDAMTSADIQEHIEYVAGWNDCRQAMMEMMK
jgi:hypothetical protein